LHQIAARQFEKFRNDRAAQQLTRELWLDGTPRREPDRFEGDSHA
jgi:hypothetical protein